MHEESVTVAVTATYRVEPGRENDFRSWAMAVLGAAGRPPGSLGGGILTTRAPGETGSEWRVVHLFDSEESALAWEYSLARLRWEAHANRFARDAGRRMTRGPSNWFDHPSPPVPAGAPERTETPDRQPSQPPPARPSAPSPPPKWKLWFVNMSAVFPSVLVFNLAVIPYIGGLNALIRTLLLCLCVTALVTWVLMPRLQRFFKTWLHPPLQALRGRHKRRAT
ncbi:hypothetical protein [Wenjunlia tyrosinilytica]|uniref:ABM domain-containing protein n=1 Tax=Wenjunlia tyrosinilytica TaxID=1544741 RepID=A0A918DZW7_9ACTN|nr:hypothetical protein [Wenjunlia tyrosinilytica]GGO96714.1 hypothetical protein GCM10012280_56850 [Wenjunlia tyrosinilytica]